MYFDALVNEIAEIRPIPEIARASVDLMDDHSPGIAALELSNHLAENRPAAFGRRFQFLKPLGNAQILPLRVTLNGRALLLERDAFALTGRGHTYIAIILIHGCCGN